MLWIAPSEKDNGNATLEKRLWDAADQLRANSHLKSSEYSIPVLGLIFLRYADHKFGEAEKKLAQQGDTYSLPVNRYTPGLSHFYIKK
mgnify:CR=1 FL=1